MAAGGLSVPVYFTEGIDSILHIANDSASRILFLHSPLIAEEVVTRLDQFPHLEWIVLLQGAFAHPRVLALEEFLAKGAAIAEEALEALLNEGGGEETATIVYTSGTTGLPKGVMLTHRNFLSNIEAGLRLFDIGPQDECLSFLPLSHVFERMAGYYLMLHQGAVIAYAESFESVPANLAEVRPTIVVSVPRLYEKMYARVMERVLAGSWLTKQLFFAALGGCRRLVRRQQAAKKSGVLLPALAGLARRTVFSRLRRPLGGRLRFFVSGGAPLGREVAEFFHAVGLPIYEGYGLTETSPVLAVNTPEAMRLGSVGLPLPGTEIRLAEDGEILARGPGVFQGYWHRPEETAAAFDGDWFRTGDIGEIDAGGFLFITDRKKDLIVTAGGENVAPQVLENRFKTDKFIASAMVYGERKPFLTALFVPNFDNIEKYAHYKGIDFLNHCDLVNHPRILDLLRRRIDRLQQVLPPIERIKRFTLLSRDFSAQEGEVTPTLKVKRKVVEEHFQRVLEGMYLPRDHALHDQGYCVVESEH
jgi:long-chain acyl-CoA synthetase